jgi:hypothetical protein
LDRFDFIEAGLEKGVGGYGFCGSDEPFQPFPCMGGQAGLWAEYMRRFYGYF